jgi:hypothetical protein
MKPDRAAGAASAKINTRACTGADWATSPHHITRTAPSSHGWRDRARHPLAQVSRPLFIETGVTGCDGLPHMIQIKAAVRLPPAACRMHFSQNRASIIEVVGIATVILSVVLVAIVLYSIWAT